MALDKERLNAAFEAYWAADGSTFNGIEAAIVAYLGAANKPVSPSDAAISVSRERRAKEQRDLHATRTIDDRSDWPKDGFINDYD